MRRNLFQTKRFWLGLAITAIFLFWVFRKVDGQALARAMAGADYIWLLPALAVYLAGYWVRAVRWQYLIKSIKPLPWQRLLPPLMVGFMANNILPARAGELVLAYVAGKREQISKSAVFATVMMQRVLDGLVMVLMAVSALALFDLPKTPANAHFVDGVNAMINLTAVLFGLVFAGLFAGITWKKAAQRVLFFAIQKMPGRVRPMLEKISASFLDGLSVLRHWGDSLLAMLFSLLAWSGESAAYYFVLKAFHLALPVYAAVMLMAVVNLGIMIPSSPGYIGPFEFFGVGILLLFGIEKNLSLPAILVIHSFVWLPITLWGFYYMWAMNLSFQEIESAKTGETGHA